MQSKKPRSNGKIFMSHGLLRCQSSTHSCNAIHNRDKNAVKNMLNLADTYAFLGERQLSFSRAFSL